MPGVSIPDHGDRLGLGLALKPYQRRILRDVLDPSVDVVAASLPRGAGKTAFAGRLAGACLAGRLDGGGAAGSVALFAGSARQAKLLHREACEVAPAGCRVRDSNSEISLTTEAGARLEVYPSAGAAARRAFGLGARERLLVCDEPASWDERGGSLVWDAILTSIGKRPGLTVLVVGTLAPARAGSWWPSLVAAGAVGRRRVHVLAAGDDEPWDDLRVALRVNPLARGNPALRAALRAERDEARRDELARSRFKAYRLNQLTGAGGRHLVEPGDWRRVLSRPVGERRGPAVLGLDLGASRSWSAAALVWPATGRVEARASVPGIPALPEQEHAAGMPRGMLAPLVEAGVVAVAHGSRMARIQTLLDALPDVEIVGAVADRFAAGEVSDALAGRGLAVEWRVNQWSSASTDIAAFRRAVLDGPLSVSPESRSLLTYSLEDCEVETDTSGNCKMRKAHRYRRDDVGQALVLAAGAAARWNVPTEPARVYTL